MLNFLLSLIRKVIRLTDKPVVTLRSSYLILDLW